MFVHKFEYGTSVSLFLLVRLNYSKIQQLVQGKFKLSVNDTMEWN